MKHRLFLSLSATLLLAVPASTLLPGCGGGGSGLAQGTYSSSVALTSSQTGFLTITAGAGSSVATGTLRVTNTNAADKSTSAITLAIPNGTYQLSGNFSPPSAFSVTGSFPGFGPFFITGQIPVNGGNGNYSITVSGQTVNGNFATGNATPTPGATTTATTTPTVAGTATATPLATATSRPLPTATPVAVSTATPIPSTTGNNRVENILFSNVVGVNARSIAPFTAGITGSALFKNDAGGFVGTAFFATVTNGVTRKLTFEGPQRSSAVSAGETFPLGGSGEGNGLANLFYSEVASNGVEKSWAAQSGTYTVVSGDSNRVNFSISNAKFAPASNAGGATGTFTLNGRGNVGK